MPRRTLTAFAVAALTAGAALAAPTVALAAPTSVTPVTPVAVKSSTLTTPVNAAYIFYSDLVFIKAAEEGNSRSLTYLPRINTALKEMRDNGNYPTFVDRKSITDKNHNKYEDDGKITFRFSYNSACLTLATGAVVDHACGAKKPVNWTPLQRASKTTDAESRWFVGTYAHTDPLSLWSTDMLTYIAEADIDGVKATITDRNHDGLEDDGRVEFTKNGKKVCLTLPRNIKSKSVITFGKCATSKRGLPDDANKVKQAQAAANVKADLKNAATTEETAITDNPTADGFAFTSTYAKPATIGGVKVEVSKGTTLVGTVKTGVGYCIKGTSTLAPGKTFWYDSANGGIKEGNARPKGGAC